jgi:hypothetical protein
MWLPNWTPQTAIPPLTLFAAQAWQELLSPQTPDTFQARVLDLPTLLQELADVAALSGEDERWAAYLPMIGEELQDARQVEATYLARDARLRAAIEAVVTNIAVDSKTPKIMYERAQIALTVFGPIEKRWKDHAQELANGNTREKALFLHRLSTLATHVLARGLEEESLAMISADACEAAPAAFIEIITACVSDQSREFHCVVALDGERGDLAALIGGSRFNQVGKGHGIRHDPVSRDWHTSNDGRFFVGILIQAVSPRMAAERCLQELSTLLNVQNLYHNSATFRAVARILVYDGDKPLAVEVSPEKHFGLFPRSEYRKLSRDTYSLVGTRLEGRISNALECHALALSADNPKTAMINLWTALETITGSMGTKSIGSRVADRIAPIVAYRRVDKIATYLALSVHATVRRDGQGIDRNLLPASNNDFIAPDDILRAVTGKEDNDTIKYLFSRCSVSPLLLNRLFSEWKEFHDPRTLATSIARSKTRVEWQIARIYRARNLLVHRGEQSPYTWRLLRNAHYYVSSAISRVLHDLRDRPSWTVDTSLVHQGQRYAYLHDQFLRHEGEAIMFSDLLLRKTRTADSLVWSNPPTPTQQ